MVIMTLIRLPIKTCLPHASANPAIKQLYMNGHFYYDYKFGMITNGLGIVRDITFYNKDFLDAHPGIIVGRKVIHQMMINLYPIQKL